MTPEEKLVIEEKIVTMLKTVFDPEIPVDIYNLGLIYAIDLDDDGNQQIFLWMMHVSSLRASMV